MSADQEKRYAETRTLLEAAREQLRQIRERHTEPEGEPTSDTPVDPSSPEAPAD
jgi:hypothetical protein